LEGTKGTDSISSRQTSAKWGKNGDTSRPAKRKGGREKVDMKDLTCTLKNSRRPNRKKKANEKRLLATGKGKGPNLLPGGEKMRLNQPFNIYRTNEERSAARKKESTLKEGTRDRRGTVTIRGRENVGISQKKMWGCGKGAIGGENG